MPIDREKLREVEKTATRGPWAMDDNKWYVFSCTKPTKYQIAALPLEGDWEAIENADQRIFNGALIVAARNALPGLLDELDARAAEIRALRSVVASQTELLDECREVLQQLAVAPAEYAYHLAIDARALLEKLSPPEEPTNES